MPKNPTKKVAKKRVKLPYRGVKRITAIPRDMMIFDFRKDGYSYAEISDMLQRKGITLSPEGCRNVINRTLANVMTNLTETIEEVRALEEQRIDKLYTIANKIATGRGKAFNKLAAIDRCNALGKRRAEIRGLNVEKSESKQEVTVRIYDGVKESDI